MSSRALAPLVLFGFALVQSCQAGQSCTAIGCSSDLVTLRFTDSTTWPEGAYIVTIDGTKPSCILEKTQRASNAGGAPGLAASCSTSSFNAVFVDGELEVALQTTPNLLSINVQGPEGTRSWADVAPDYELSYPNGYDCDYDTPCRNAEVDLEDPTRGSVDGDDVGG